jgi:hypothetical protein
MDAFSAMGYPHWLIVAGTLLVLLGSIGLAYRQTKRSQVELTEIAMKMSKPGPSLRTTSLRHRPIGRPSLRSKRRIDGPNRNPRTTGRSFLTGDRNDRAASWPVAQSAFWAIGNLATDSRLAELVSCP